MLSLFGELELIFKTLILFWLELYDFLFVSYGKFTRSCWSLSIPYFADKRTMPQFNYWGVWVQFIKHRNRKKILILKMKYPALSSEENLSCVSLTRLVSIWSLRMWNVYVRNLVGNYACLVVSHVVKSIMCEWHLTLVKNI